VNDPWAVAERARCLTELAALKQGGSIQFDEGCGPRDITEDHIARLEKWVQVLDAITEDNRQQQERLPNQDHGDHGDRGQASDGGSSSI
jgi:hypothetical protein